MDEVERADEAEQRAPVQLGWKGKLSICLGSLLLSLLAAELVASAVHHHAFPFLNIFKADARFGVRLLPNAATRVRSRDGHLTDISTNSLGFRGPEWPAGARSVDEERVLLLGDSQMFGYGVAFSEALPSQLERVLPGKVRVLDAAVPSWGPAESVLAISQLAPIHHPSTVLFVANAANDWFETVPNSRRTSARDGWAVRAGGAEPTSFPFRSFLMGRSHLVLAVRQLLKHIGEPQLPPADAVLLLKRDLEKLRQPQGARRSKLTVALEAAVKACLPWGCKVIAVALPVDVQVSSSEWQKYRVKPEDVSATEALLTDFLADARELGLPTVNLLPVLRDAEPGAFLSDDYHLSGRGHQASAAAIARTLLAEREKAVVQR